MNPEVFCYLGLLRFPEQMERSLALLPEGMRSEVAKALPKNELVQRWSRLREDESSVMIRNAHKQFGIHLDEMPPVMRDWVVSQLGDSNG